MSVTVQELGSVPELAEAEALFAATWPGQPPASTGLLRAVSHAGGYVSGVRDSSGSLLGAAMGFLWFNLSKLGAGIGAYLPDFYGRMDDGVNDGDPTDRLLAVWDVGAESAATPAADPVAHRAGECAVPALEEVDGYPVPRAVPPDAALVAVATPEDVESLRRGDPALATRWRFAVREALVPALTQGTVTGFTRAGSYLVRRGTSPG